MNNRILSLALALVFLIPTVALSQSKEDVINSFNSAFKLAQSENHLEAYNGFKKTIEMADAVGADVADIKDKAEKQLAPLMFKYAGELYKSKKVNEALASFEEAGTIARQYGDENLAGKADGVRMKLFNNLGTKEFKQANYDVAIEWYNKALAINSNYDAAIFNVAEALNKQNKKDESIAMLDKARQVGERTNRQSIIRKAERKAAENLIYWGTTSIEAQKYSEAADYLNKALIYDSESSDAYYRLAELANKQGDYDDAINYSEQALDFEKGAKSAKAKIYFELGLAYQFKGQKSAACEAFKNASFGRFKASAEHKIEFELKCGEAK